MNIVQVNTSDIQGGAARAAWHLHDELRRAGCKSTMLAKFKTSGDDDVHAIDYDPENPALRRWASRWDKYITHNRTAVTDCLFSLPVPGYNLALHPIVQAADIIHLHWVVGLLAPAGIARLLQLGKPVVWTLHDQRPFTGGCHYSFGCDKYQATCDGCPQLGNRAPKLTRGVLAQATRAFDASRVTVVTPSKWMAACTSASTLFRRSQVHVIPNGVDTHVFRPTPRSEARRQIGIDPAGICFLFGADMIHNRRKGIDVLLGALAICDRDETFRKAVHSGQVQFVSYGTDSEKYDYGNAIIRGFGQIDRDERLALLYAAADVFICPTLEDNLPTTVLEALSCGTAVLASDVGGVPDMVKPKRNGLLVKPGDAEALAAAIRWIIENSAVLPQWSVNARQDIEANFTLALQARRQSELYASLLQRSPVRSRRTSPSSPQKLPLLPRAWRIPGPVQRRWPKWLRSLFRTP
jgi:glycosyltransferase involved in cell wall biosynthesis